MSRRPGAHHSDTSRTTAWRVNATPAPTLPLYRDAPITALRATAASSEYGGFSHRRSASHGRDRPSSAFGHHAFARRSTLISDSHDAASRSNSPPNAFPRHVQDVRRRIPLPFESAVGAREAGTHGMRRTVEQDRFAPVALPVEPLHGLPLVLAFFSQRCALVRCANGGASLCAVQPSTMTHA